MLKLPSLQPSTQKIPQRAASPLSRGPGDFDTTHSLITFKNRIAHSDQPGVLRHGIPSDPLKATPLIETGREGYDPPTPHIVPASHISLQSHSPCGSFDTDIEDNLPVQTRATRVRIEPCERPVERIPRELIPIPASSVMRYSRNIRM